MHVASGSEFHSIGKTCATPRSMTELIIASLASFAAGFVNSIAGGRRARVYPDPVRDQETGHSAPEPLINSKVVADVPLTGLSPARHGFFVSMPPAVLVQHSFCKSPVRA
jgi:hypothetical protein